MLIRAAIFDMDGLMLDTEPLYRTAWKQASAECGFDLTDEIYKQFVGRSRVDGFQSLVDTFGPQFRLQRFEAAVAKNESSAFLNTPLSKKPGLEALLRFLESRKIPTAVATSTEQRRALPMLKLAGLLNKFKAVVTSDEVARGKPFPDIFLAAAQRLGVEPGACLVLGDAESGVMAANKAGAHIYVVPDMVAPSDATKHLAHGIFASLHDVLKNLEHAARSSSSMGIILQSFKTERLNAFPLGPYDRHELTDMHRNPVVMATLGGVKSEDEACRWLSDNLAHWDRHGFGIWVFRDRRDGSFVGRAGLRDVEVDGVREVELGYALLDEYWGMGLASEMAQEVLEIGFGRLQLKSIVALIAAENYRSQRIAKKMGFHFERTVVWKNLPAGLYRLLRPEWLRGKSY